MILGKDVTIANNVFISDHLHGFDDISCGVMPHPLPYEFFDLKIKGFIKVVFIKSSVREGNDIETRDIRM